MTETHDFGDGPVPSHRHQNPDGTLGGWVADTAAVGRDATVGRYATVGPYATVDQYATVGRRAIVGRGARVGPDATVGRHAIVGPDATVGRHAIVGPGATVGQGATVGPDARVVERHQIITVAPVGSEDRTVTCYRTETGHSIQAGCWTGTVDELRARIADPSEAWPDLDPDDRDRVAAEYAALCDLFAPRVATWHPADMAPGGEAAAHRRTCPAVAS